MGQKLAVLGVWRGKIWKMNVKTLLGNQSPSKHVVQCKKFDSRPYNSDTYYPMWYRVDSY